MVVLVVAKDKGGVGLCGHLIFIAGQIRTPLRLRRKCKMRDDESIRDMHVVLFFNPDVCMMLV